MEGLIFGMLRYVMYCYPYTTLHRFRSLGISSFFQVETELSGGGEGGSLAKKKGFSYKNWTVILMDLDITCLLTCLLRISHM